MQIPSVNLSSYQNNPNWAFNNKQKGFIASCFSLGSTASGVVRACSSKDSKVYEVSNLLEKIFYSVSNWLQYLLFERKDDVLGDDEEKRPLAGKVGEITTFQEKYVNPIAKPLSTLLNANQQEGLNDALSFPDAFYWKIRFALEKINLEDFKLVPNFLRDIFNKEVNVTDKKRSTNEISKIVTAMFAFIGTLCIGAFTPVKVVLKLIDKESKIINLLTAIGKATIEIPYFFKFTLPLLWEAVITKDKKCHAVFGVGTAANIMNTALPVVELIPKQNNFLMKFCELYKSLTSNLLSLFFALRRNHLGSEWLKINSEYQ